MQYFSKAFLEKTIRIWQPYSSTPLSLQDAEKIAKNVTELLEFLAQLDTKYGNAKERLSRKA